MRLRVLRSVAWVILLLTGCSSAPPSPMFGGRPLQEHEEWPQELTGPDGSKLVLYQPQVERWTDSKVLRGRMALAFQRAGTTTPVLGAVVLEADTETSLEIRQVRLSKLRVVEGGFPGLGPTGSDRIVDALRQRLTKEDVLVSLDRILAYLERAETALKPAPLKTDPPKILVSTRPAILVITDGAPVMSPIPGSVLRYAVNTNWDLLLDPATSSYYLRSEDTWLRAASVRGPWAAAGALPKGFADLPRDPNWEDVRRALPGRAIAPDQIPTVFVSEEPAELILLQGAPKLETIPGTALSWIPNTESDLFFSSADRRYYYLVSGRWFRAERLEGPWTFATPDLPADFARIPPGHPQGDVLPLVPGTKQAQEAVIQAHIPQTARVERKKVAPPAVTYQGAPEFKSIEGTALAYAANTPYDVIKVGDLYYLCFQAVWFVSRSPSGPWEVADKVPGDIYDIPPSAPVYHATYVYVYDTDPDYITYGYLPGYYGAYFAWGVMAFGTGWYYPPYTYWGPVYPVYYPYAYSYGAGAWYNPNTGTYGRGAIAYGPYGGVGRAAAYNPSTGTYARGAAAYGPYQSRAWAEAYNPRTGTYAQTRQGSNAYGSWGTTGVVRGDDWVRTARVSGSAGSAAGYRTSAGGSGVVVRGDNNVYAGRDGQVYRRTDEGWQRHEGGQWQGVARPEPGTAVQRERPAASARTVDSGTYSGLSRDAQYRAQGSERAAQSRSWSSGAAGGARPSPAARGSYGGRGGGRR